MLECMDKNCRTVILAKNTDGLSCVRCGGRMTPMPFAPMRKYDEEGTLEVNTITPDATSFYEKNIGLIADEVYKRMSEDFQRGLRTRTE